MKSISWACRLRPEVWMWYFSFCERSLAPYLRFMAVAQMRRATRPITAYSGSRPFEKKKLRFGAKSSIASPRLR
ncbi:hypothetical protein D3C72_2099130 [compost metagenome]